MAFLVKMSASAVYILDLKGKVGNRCDRSRLKVDIFLVIIASSFHVVLS
mgnify:CR=1 FL=1